jgi:hypothetical protein
MKAINFVRQNPQVAVAALIAAIAIIMFIYNLITIGVHHAI